MQAYRNGTVARREARSGTEDAGRRYMPVLDGIRGLAAAMVVLFHLQGSFGRIGFPHSYLAVDLFFVMSALVLWSSYGERLDAGMRTSAFVALRLVRLYPLYLLGIAIGVAVACLSRRPAPGEVALALLMLPDLRGNSPFPFDGPAWSLFFEVIGSVGLALLATRLTAARLLAAVAAGLAAAVAVALLKPEPNLNMGFTSHTLVGGLARLVADFALGLLLARVLLPRIDARARRPDRRRSGALGSWLPMLLAFAVLAVPLGGRLALPYDIAAVTLACPAILALAALARPGPRLTAAFRLAGVVSFPLYALHAPIRDGVALFAERYGSASAGPAALVAAFALAVVAALAADRLYDRPLRRMLSARRSRRRAAALQMAGAANAAAA